MEVGIVGLPNVGKSALFKALTGMNVEVANFPFTTREPAKGTAPVPDPRLQLIGKYIETRKYVPATLDLVDLPAIAPGSSTGEGMGNEFLKHVRQVDALLHVVRCFEDPEITHSSPTLDPVRDAQTVDTELILSDLQVIESAMDKADRKAKTGDAAAKKRVEVCRKAAALLETEKPLRTGHWTDAELLDLKALGMLTLKPVLYVANVGEDDLQGAGPMPAKLSQWVKAQGSEAVPVCAKLEAEIAELKPEERTEMLAGLGLTEPVLAVLARTLYRVLGYQSFYTAGITEIRAWTVRKGATAPEAAGAVHSDIQRGFIRAETYSVEDLVKFGSEQAIKAAGKMRSEGKSYVMQDGDVCHYLFNV